MQIKFQADNDLKRAIVSGVKRRQPAIDFQTAQDAQLDGMPDDDVLAFAASEGRVLVSHDRRTMPVHFANFITRQESAGAFLIEQSLNLRDAIDELLLIWEASEAEEWRNRIEFLPL